MTAVRRMIIKTLGGTVGALALAASNPAAAQNSDAPVDVTAAPPPSSETVGPAQLRDFNLNGTVTRPADRPSTTAPQPAPSTQPRPTVRDIATDSPAGPSRRAVSPTSAGPAPSPGSAGIAGGRPQPTPETVTPPLPTQVATDPVPQPSYDPVAQTDSSSDQGGFPSWPWLAAVLALVGGGAFVLWSRRQKRERYGDPGRMAFAGLVPDVAPEPGPLPPIRPRANPVPPRAAPTAPRAHPIPPRPEPAPERENDGLIVSTRLKPELAIQFAPDRAVVTESDVALQFDVVVANSGSAPARDVLVEARMVCAHAGQDAEIAGFFQQPIGKGDRIAAIPPLGRISLKSVVRLPLAQLNSFQVEGRTLFVPLVAFNILFGNNSQTSASFLVGRGSEEDEKLAPFRLDLGPRVFRGLSARPHSMGLTR